MGNEIKSTELYVLEDNGASWAFYVYRKALEPSSLKLLKKVEKVLGKSILKLTSSYHKGKFAEWDHAWKDFTEKMEGEGVVVNLKFNRKVRPSFVMTRVEREVHLELTDELSAVMPLPKEDPPLLPLGMSSEDIIEVMRAYKQGKQIEKRFLGEDDWVLDPNPIWAFDRIQYRVKGQRMTNRELAEWLAKGKGQVTNTDSESAIASTNYNYSPSYDNAECLKGLSVRPWGCDEWVTPTKEMLNE